MRRGTDKGTITAYGLKEIAQEYHRLRIRIPLGTLRTKKDYQRATEILDAILDEIGEDEKHPLADLADALGVFIERYEVEHVRFPKPYRPPRSNS